MPDYNEHMKPPIWITVLLFVSTVSIFADDSSPHLYIPDGQILTTGVKAYVSSINLDQRMKPSLQLEAVHAQGRTKIDEKGWEPFVVAPNQSWTEKIEGQSVAQHGTLLIFDLNQFKIPWFKSTTRVTPILTWQPADLQSGSPKPMLLSQPVYLGSFWGALGWTILIVGALVIFIARLAAVKSKETSVEKKHKGVLQLVSGEDGYMSLWRTQLAAWTIAVGSMVFLFGLIQLAVPHIPDSLVALMGMSVATGSLSAIADKSNKHSAKPEPAKTPKLSHLISSFNPIKHEVFLSMPKAQMVFWTGIILILFVVKSTLSGELWEVPWELVTLTGVSQAGYVGDKAIQHPAQS